MRKLLLLILVLLLAACAADPNRDFIQGAWVATGEGRVATGGTAMEWQII